MYCIEYFIILKFLSETYTIFYVIFTIITIPNLFAIYIIYSTHNIKCIYIYGLPQ